MIATKTVRWQCSGCDHLCALLLDELIKPEEIIGCAKGKWRVEILPAAKPKSSLREKIAEILYGELTYKNYLKVPSVRQTADSKIDQIIALMKGETDG